LKLLGEKVTVGLIPAECGARLPILMMSGKVGTNQDLASVFTDRKKARGETPLRRARC
jgi:hypothetical protein